MSNIKSNSKQKKRKYFSSYPKLVALSFICLILIGTFLLMLPISVKTGTVSFLDALFTATSASCVTGLIIFDTFTKWSLFGQLVILCLIQIGGLGFITIMTMLSRFIKKQVSLKEKLILRESVGTIYNGDLRSLVNVVLTGTVLFELIGAAVLSTQFIPKMGLKNGLYTSVFLSVSAFCNAGFDVLGRIEPGSSLITVNDNPVIIVTISLLIIIGGIGFIVWYDILKNKRRFKKMMLHTKLTLITTTLLLMIGAVLFAVFEWNGTLSNMPVWQKILNALFASVTPRTAGFNSIAINKMRAPSTMLTYILMFIGGCAGSTAGGIKTTTLAVLVLCTISTLKNKRDIEIFGRRITPDTVKKSAAIVTINFMIVFAASSIISMCQKELAYKDILFECFSAIGTVGMTAGITPSLETPAKIIITIMMFVGRVSSLVFAFSLMMDGNTATSTKKPSGSLMIG